MNRRDLYDILRNIVATHSPAPARPESFIVIDTPAPDFHAPALGYEFRHYLEGAFWSRPWVLEGADPNTMRAAYPILAAECTAVNIEDITTGRASIEAYLVLIASRTDRTDCHPTTADLRESVAAELVAILRALYNTRRYLLTRAGDMVEAWALPQRVTDLLTAGMVDDAEELYALSDTIRPDAFGPLRDWGEGLAAFGIVGMAARVILPACIQPAETYLPAPAEVIGEGEDVIGDGEDVFGEIFIAPDGAPANKGITKCTSCQTF